jgi:multidrug efflux pump subunit AcrA (membrane-fusion protein)
MTNYRVNIGFTGYSDGDLDEFTTNIVTNLTGNASFPAPPVKLADLSKLQTGFETALAAAAQGGTQLTAAKNAAREALEDALRIEATYVQSIASHDLPMLLSSGFQANSTNRAQTPLDIPAIAGITNDITTKLTVRLQPVGNARAYQVRAGTGNNGNTVWLPTVDSTQARRVMLPNLAPGTTYTVQVRAGGGVTGYSDWSDPVSHMAT